MNTQNTQINQLDAENINRLQAKKEKADERVRDLLKKAAFFREKVSTSGEGTLFDERIVSILDKGDDARKIEAAVNKLKQINDELVNAAPMFFSHDSQAFKTPTILKNVHRLHITRNEAVNSQQKTGLQLSKKLERMQRDTLRDIKAVEKGDSDNKQAELDELNQVLTCIQAELAMFLEQKDKIFRLRRESRTDVQAIYLQFGDDKSKKARVNAGGLIAIKVAGCKDENFKVIDKPYAARKPLYEEVTPIETIMDLNGKLYDDDEVEAVRRQRAEQNGKNEAKIRPKNEPLVN